MEPRYPGIVISMGGGTDKVITIMARCARAMHDAGLPKAEREAFFDQCQQCASDQEFLALVARTFETE
jgi:hypothetical protein